MSGSESIRLAAPEDRLPSELRHLLLAIHHPDFHVEPAGNGPADATLIHADGMTELPDDGAFILFGTGDELGEAEAHPQVLGVIEWPAEAAAVSRALARCARWLRRERQLRAMAYTDALTGLLNRRGFEEQADRSIARARYDGPASAVLLIDIDHFKRLNDSYGHAAGDAVLRHVGALVRRHVRPGDIVGRIGGEELAIILPAASLDVALATAERLRAAVERAVVTFEGSGLRTTVSIGVASTGLASYHAAALRAADEAMYRAKALGRNRVAGASPPLFWQAKAPEEVQIGLGSASDSLLVPVSSRSERSA